MPESLLAEATELEALLPRVMRGLFHHAPDDPLADLPVAQLRVLRLLLPGSKTPTEIGHALGMSPSAVTQIVNRLESAGLAERTEDLQDRRLRHLRLTAEGLERMSNRRSRRVQTTARVLEKLPPTSRTDLIVLLARLAEAGESTRLENSRSDSEFEALVAGRP